LEKKGRSKTYEGIEIGRRRRSADGGEKINDLKEKITETLEKVMTPLFKRKKPREFPGKIDITLPGRGRFPGRSTSSVRYWMR